MMSERHERDEDCDVDPETAACRGCGVDHGGECFACGGHGFHRGGCAALAEAEQCDL